MAYSIGVDFGTESGRVLLFDLATGRELTISVISYRHGVIDRTLPGTGKNLPPDWALQHPMDYIEVLLQGIPNVLRDAGINPDEVIGLGIDFTSCTVMPVMEDATPLCMLTEWQGHAHAWPKLWKHHAAQPIADRINAVGEKRGEVFLSRYGGRISSEWYFPKLLEVFEKDREVYDACYAYVEAADWIVWYLTGQERRNSCTAGFKAMWSRSEGVPDNAFFESVNPEFTNPTAKLGNRFYELGSRAGTLRIEMAEATGLSTRVVIAVGNVDAHVSVPGAGVYTPGTLVMVMGTSLCHLTITEDEVRLPGITGVVKDGVLPGSYGYEAGQAAVGDMFAWFVKNAVPTNYLSKAKAQGISIYTYLEGLAQELKPGQSGLVALDWWNGNRSTIGDSDLSGVILGLSLSTSPEAIYRALLESTAFGTRRIIDNFIDHGVPIRELVACGGLPQKSPLLMQIYADICGIRVVVPNSNEIAARGAALFGAVAAGGSQGGFSSIEEACSKLNPLIQKIYEPNPEAETVYKKLYHVYSELYDLLGRDKVHLLHTIKDIRMAIHTNEKG